MSLEVTHTDKCCTLLVTDDEEHQFCLPPLPPLSVSEDVEWDIASTCVKNHRVGCRPGH